jgi:hypothetical protein
LSFGAVVRLAGIMFSATAGTALGLAAAALGTASGRHVVVGAGLGLANDALRGRVTIDSVGGSVYEGLVAHGVRVVGDDARPLAEIAGLNLRYRLGDLLSRRIVLGQIELTGALVTLERRAGERFNYQHVLRLGEGAGGGGGGRGLLVAFRNVRVIDLVIALRTPTAPDDSTLAERRVVVPSALLSYVRLSSPFPGEDAIEFDVAALRVDLPRPALTVEEAVGRIGVLGDTVTLDLSRVRLPGTRSSLRGRLWALGDGPRFDLTMAADRLRAEDLADLFDWLPPGVSGAGEVAAQSPAKGRVRVRASNLRLVTANGGTVRGTLAMQLGPDDAWRVDDADLVTADFDLAYLRGLLDTVPMDGRLTGTTRARGPRDSVVAAVDWVFHDRRADSAATAIAGAGAIGFGVPGDVVFRAFRVDSATVALSTVRAIAPSVALTGVIEAAGVLDGEYRNANFEGALAHRPDDQPVTRAQGAVRLDLRADTVGVWGTLAFDSVQWDGLRPSYPRVPLVGAMAGAVRLAGFLDALELHVTLAGPAGSLEGGGVVTLADPRLGVRDLDLQFTDLSLPALERRLPATRLSGRVTGWVEADTLVAPTAEVVLALAPSLLGGARLDSLWTEVRLRDSTIVVDTLRAWLRDARLVGRGGLALRAPRSDTVTLELTADSLAALAPLLLRVAGRDTAALALDTLRGRASGSVTVSGALDALDAAFSVAGPRVDWNDVTAHGPRASGRWSSGAAGRVAVQVEIDSVLVGADDRYHGLVGAAVGHADSVHWSVRSGIGRYASVRAGGVWVRRSSYEVRPDSLIVATAGETWSLAPEAVMTVTDTTIAVRGLTLATPSGRSRISLSGVVPRVGTGSFEGAIEGLPLAHLWGLLQRDPETAAGDLSGTFRVGGSAREPVIDAAFSMRDAVFDEFRAPLTDGTVAYRERQLTGTLNMWRSGTRVLGVDLELPLDLGFTGVRRRRLPGPLTVRARADGVDLALLSATSPMVRRTEGRLWADVGITGGWDRPQLQGFLEIRDGGATFPTLGVRHSQLNGRLTLAGDTIRVDSLTVTSGAGRARIRGTVRLVELTSPLFDLTVTANEFRAIDVPRFLTLTVSGAVRLEGHVFGARLTGAGTIPRGVVHFADIIEKDIVRLEEAAALDSAAAAVIREERLGPDFENRFLDSLRVDSLALEMGSDVRLRSNEADIQLTGQVVVSKNADRYRIDGTLGTPRGSYELYLGPALRKRFTVTRGEVRYFGTPDLNAALDIDARHQLRGARGEDVTVIVHVGGTILEPRLRLSSDVQPPLSETELISYLVFGGPNAQVSGGVGRYGLESIASFAGQITGQLSSQLIADLGVPLDFFEVRPQFGERGVEGTDIAIGRRLSDRVIVTLSPRICRKQSFTVQNVGWSVEFELGAGWSILTSADPVRVCSLSGTAGFGTQYQLGADLFWERRF